MAYPNGVAQNEKQFEPIADEIVNEYEKILGRLPMGTSPTESVGKRTLH